MGFFASIYLLMLYLTTLSELSAVKRLEFISGRMSYIILRGRWCDIIVLNVHAPTEEKL
jgi:hypothetical protein